MTDHTASPGRGRGLGAATGETWGTAHYVSHFSPPSCTDELSVWSASKGRGVMVGVARWLPRIGAVVVEQRAAPLLGVALRRLLRSAAEAGLRPDPVLLDLAAACRAAEVPGVLPVTVGAGEAAAMLGVSPEAVRAAARDGRLIGHQDGGGAWRFTRGAVDDWRDRRDRNGRTPPQGPETG